MKDVVNNICSAIVWVTFILCCFFYCTRADATSRREQPSEVLCTSNGFVIYNGMAIGLKKLSPNRYSFVDLTHVRNQTRVIYGQCYRYIEGVWEQPRKESK